MRPLLLTVCVSTLVACSDEPAVTHVPKLAPVVIDGACPIQFHAPPTDPAHDTLLLFSNLEAHCPNGQPCFDEIGLFVCPVEPERSRVWFRMALTDFESSDAEILAFQHTIFTQDQPVLESQRPRRLPVSGGELHSAADRLSSAYRRYLRERGITFGVC